MLSRVSLLAIAAMVAANAIAFGVDAQSIDRSRVAPSVDQPSLLGRYLAGREAWREGDRAGVRMLTEAALAAPDQAGVREQAFGAALLSGDIPAAAKLAPDAPGTPDQLRDVGRIVRIVEALAQDHGAEAKGLLAEPASPSARMAVRLLRPFVEAAAGDWKAATSVHDSQGDRLAEVLGSAARAQLLERHGLNTEAEMLYRTLAQDSAASALFVTPYADFLERRGRWADAVALYDEALKRSAGDPVLATARLRATRRAAPPPAPDIRRGAGQALSYAAVAMAGQRATESALIYARLALRLDPTLDQSWVFAGDALAVQHNETEARAAWANVRPGSPFFLEARTRVAYSLQRSGDGSGALRIMDEVLAAAPDNFALLYVQADLQRADSRYADASNTLDRVVAAGGDQDWHVLYSRALVRDRLGRWPEAEADARKALALAPDEPELLNYLGYNLVDRGENLKDGLTMVERAAVARPRSGAMQDSLGWAHYRMGDFGKAVDLLEGAVSLEAADPSINDHLGDAYWMVGRRDEATYQWRRVLSLTPEAELKTAAEAKLAHGLGSKSAAGGAATPR